MNAQETPLQVLQGIRRRLGWILGIILMILILNACAVVIGGL